MSFHKLLIILFLSVESLCFASNVTECEQLIEYRDSGKLLNQLDQANKNYEKYRKQYEVFNERLKGFNKEYSANSLKWQSLADSLLLTANTTGMVLSSLLPNSYINATSSLKVSEQVLASVDKIKYGIDVYQADSSEDRVQTIIFQRADKNGNTVKYIGKIFQSLEIVTSLLEAKERFNDRKETISLLNNVERELKNNHKQFKKKYEKSIHDIDALNKLKNAIDGICNIKSTVNKGESEMYHSKSTALDLAFIEAVNKGQKLCINDNGYYISLALVNQSCKPSPYTKNEFKCNVRVEVTCQSIKCKKYYCGTDKPIKKNFKDT